MKDECVCIEDGEMKAIRLYVWERRGQRAVDNAI